MTPSKSRGLLLLGRRRMKPKWQTITRRFRYFPGLLRYLPDPIVNSGEALDVRRRYCILCQAKAEKVIRFRMAQGFPGILDRLPPDRDPIFNDDLRFPLPWSTSFSFRGHVFNSAMLISRKYFPTLEHASSGLWCFIRCCHVFRPPMPRGQFPSFCIRCGFCRLFDDLPANVRQRFSWSSRCRPCMLCHYWVNLWVRSLEVAYMSTSLKMCRSIEVKVE